MYLGIPEDAGHANPCSMRTSGASSRPSAVTAKTMPGAVSKLRISNDDQILKREKMIKWRPVTGAKRKHDALPAPVICLQHRHRCMEKKDFRSLGRDAMETLRFQAVFPVLELHKTQAEAAEAVGVSRQTVNQWLRNHATEGEKAFLDRRRISARKGKGRLTEAEARRVQRWIKDKCPEQLKLPYALWTAGVVRELIRRRLGKHLGLSTVQPEHISITRMYDMQRDVWYNVGRLVR
jgi:transposase